MESTSGITAVFFDIRDTLGVVDRSGHLLKFAPSSDQLLKFAVANKLKIGLITNLPANVSTAVGRKMVEDVGIAALIDPQGFVTNHEAGVEKPNPEIYRFAAKQIGVPIKQCLFVGENLPEVIGAQQAGMKAVLKPFPPGREFLNRPIPANANGVRLFQLLLTEEHQTIGRILAVAERVVQKLDADRVAALESPVVRHVLGTLVTLLEQAWPAHHARRETEIVLPLALARGLPIEATAFVEAEHQQLDLFGHGIKLAVTRIWRGDQHAARELQTCLAASCELARSHMAREEEQLFPQIAARITDADDALFVDRMALIGPYDVTLFFAMLNEIETEIG